MTKATVMPTPQQNQTRQQIRGLLWLALLVILGSIARTGLHTAFPRGWWRLW